MKRYAVEITDTALAALFAHAHFIAFEQQEPANAKRWIESAWDAIESLETMPNRCASAEEDKEVSYQVRCILVGSVSLLFTVDEERATVWVIAVRGQGQLPKPRDLPSFLS